MRDFVNWITSDDEREKLFLNTLSLMEYIGCRKILKSVSFKKVNIEVLQHISEEASHAFLLKRLVKQLWGEDLTWDSGQLSACAWDYFDKLEEDLMTQVASREQLYPILSQIIEKRVLAFYPLLAELSKHPEVQKLSKIILTQERNHSNFFDFNFPEFEKREEVHFSKFESSLRNSLTFS